MRNHARPDRIQLDIPVARERVMLRGNETGPKATLPERAAAPGPSVDALYVALAQIFHEEGADVRRVRRKKQVHMIGHQAIGVNGTVMPAGKKAQVTQVSKVIGIAEKAQAAIVAALDDMDGHFGNDDSSSAGHKSPTVRVPAPLTVK